MTVIEVVLALPTVLHLSGQALAQRVPFELDGLKGEILTPRLEMPDGDDASAVRGSLRAPDGTILTQGWSVLECDWGHVSHGRGSEVVQAAVNLVMFRGELTQEDTSAQGITEVGIHLKRRFELFLDWLQVLSGQDLSSEQASVYRFNSNDIPYLFDVSSGAPVELGRQALAGFVTTNLSSSHPQLVYAADRASSNETLPVAHTLLIEGERALRRGQLRRAAAELGSALEVGLSSALWSKLAELSVQHADRFVRDHTLGKIVSAAEDLGIVQASDNLHQRVVSLRNKAVHEAVAPKFEDACSARDLVRQVLLAVHRIPEASTARMER